jgi:uncharacterized membrane protein
MSWLSFFGKRQEHFSVDEKQRVVEAIRHAERRTSGEVRVFIENRCSYMDAIDRAAEIFYQLKMDKTDDRNGVLVYVAIKDHQLAVFGDEGIHNKVGTGYWQQEVKKMISSFNRQNYAEGIADVVTDIGEALTEYFPYNNDEDKNELPDEIVFGS